MFTFICSYLFHVTRWVLLGASTRVSHRYLSLLSDASEDLQSNCWKRWIKWYPEGWRWKVWPKRWRIWRMITCTALLWSFNPQSLQTFPCFPGEVSPTLPGVLDMSVMDLHLNKAYPLVNCSMAIGVPSTIYEIYDKSIIYIALKIHAYGFMWEMMSPLLMPCLSEVL